MDYQFVLVGNEIINLRTIIYANLDEKTQGVTVVLSGGQSIVFSGDDAVKLWQMLRRESLKTVMR